VPATPASPPTAPAAQPTAPTAPVTAPATTPTAALAAPVTAPATTSTAPAAAPDVPTTPPTAPDAPAPAPDVPAPSAEPPAAPAAGATAPAARADPLAPPAYPTAAPTGPAAASTAPPGQAQMVDERPVTATSAAPPSTAAVVLTALGVLVFPSSASAAAPVNPLSCSGTSAWRLLCFPVLLVRFIVGQPTPATRTSASRSGQSARWAVPGPRSGHPTPAPMTAVIAFPLPVPLRQTRLKPAPAVMRGPTDASPVRKIHPRLRLRTAPVIAQPHAHRSSNVAASLPRGLVVRRRPRGEISPGPGLTSSGRLQAQRRHGVGHWTPTAGRRGGSGPPGGGSGPARLPPPRTGVGPAAWPGTGTSRAGRPHSKAASTMAR
jgi:hypothetical protein